MTTDQQCEILEAAAKACGLRKDDSPYNGGGAGNTGFDLLGNLVLDWDEAEVWNSLDNSADCAEMCAKLEISHAWRYCQVRATNRIVFHDEPHDGTPEGRLKAWMFAATMVAAKIGGYEG